MHKLISNNDQKTISMKNKFFETVIRVSFISYKIAAKIRTTLSTFIVLLLQNILLDYLNIVLVLLF